MKKYLLFPIAFLVTAVALFYAWSDRSGARELKAALETARRKKESTRLEDFIPPSIPDELNVAEAPIFREFFVSGNESRLGKLAQPWKGSIRQGSGKILLCESQGKLIRYFPVTRLPLAMSFSIHWLRRGQSWMQSERRSVALRFCGRWIIRRVLKCHFRRSAR
jgi:hypothetical protein